MLIPKRLESIAKIAATTEATRFTLTAVELCRLADGRATAAACDGHRLVIATWRDVDAIQYPTLLAGGRAIDPAPGQTATHLIPAAAFAAACKAAPKRHPKPVLENVVMEESTANGTVRLASTNLDTVSDVQARTIDGEFPDYRSMTDGLGVQRIVGHFNPRLLGETLLAMAKILETVDDKSPMVTLSFCARSPENSPVTITREAKADPSLVALVMPICPAEVVA